MKSKKIIKISVITIISLSVITGFVFLILDLIDPIKQALANKSWEIVIKKFDSYGIAALFVIGFIQAGLILVTFIPAAPLQVIAGVVLNPIFAFITIMAGIFVGNLLMWVIVKRYEKLVSNYYDKKLEKVEFEERKLSKKILVLYFLPVISYGLIAYTCAKSKMKFTKYILLTTLGTIPSVIISISLGQLIVDESLFLILILALMILSFLTLRYYKYIQKLFTKKPKQDMKFFQNNVKEPNKFLYWFFKGLLKKLYFKKVNLQLKNVEIFKDVEGPFILLYNHPSFFDWMYTFIPLYPKRVNAIMAYYYFCNYRLAKVLHKLGCFPKFLYQPDISAIKNIKKVINNGGILGIAPEGRLSAYGELETLAPATEKLIKHLGAPVYIGKISGGYFTKPKWAANIRRGRVDLEYELLFTPEDLKTKSLEEINTILNKKMYYNDFKWQKENKVYFKGDKFAEGLENILYVCPECENEFTIHTKDNQIKCSHCDLDITLNNYYEFESNNKNIPETIKDWYLFQKSYEAKNILKPNYQLTTEVTLKLPDPKGKGFAIVGSGVTTLNENGLKYVGTLNNETVTKEFKLQNIPAIPFGANENFEVYHDNTLYYFVPKVPRHSVKWSVVAEALYNKYIKEDLGNE
ncbi:MAG TPA: hypothetical protein GX740_03845 [Acholeplasmataceae bacterium]|nr:hypothetical protein [Acholeplasmataceae bacterium]